MEFFTILSASVGRSQRPIQRPNFGGQSAVLERRTRPITSRRPLHPNSGAAAQKYFQRNVHRIVESAPVYWLRGDHLAWASRQLGGN
jgi:hypothetical protein